MVNCDIVVRALFSNLDAGDVDRRELWEDITETLDVNIENVSVDRRWGPDGNQTAVVVRVGHDLSQDDINYITSQARRHVRRSTGGILGSSARFEETLIGAIEAESGGQLYDPDDVTLSDSDLKGFGGVMHDNGLPKNVYGPFTAADYPEDPAALRRARDFADEAKEMRDERNDPQGAAEWEALRREIVRRL